MCDGRLGRRRRLHGGEIHRRFVERIDEFRAVGVARTGAEALESVRARQPDLILLDVYLPDKTGLDVLRQLRTERNPVSVIMITAARELDTVGTSLQAASPHMSGSHGGV